MCYRIFSNRVSAFLTSKINVTHSLSNSGNSKTRGTSSIIFPLKLIKNINNHVWWTATNTRVE